MPGGSGSSHKREASARQPSASDPSRPRPQPVDITPLKPESPEPRRPEGEPTGLGGPERPGAHYYSSRTLGEILVERGLITPEQLASAIERQKRTRRRLGHVLVEMEYTTPDAVLGALSVQLGVPATRVNDYTVQPEAVKALPEKVARRHKACPLLKVDHTLVVAIASPKDLHALDDLRFASGCIIQTMVALDHEIEAAIDRYYRSGALPATAEEAEGVVVIDAQQPQIDLHDEVAERSAVQLVDRIIARATIDGASDVHLEPMETSLRVRFRVDGTFRDTANLLSALAAPVLSRVKVLSGMDIAEHRMPQDGRISARVNGRRIDLRVSTYPTMYGEKIVLRLLDRAALKLDFSTLGVRSPTLEQFRELIQRPEGIILITGPTGSGKTSTLYAALTELVNSGKNIMTVEDPIEYSLAGVNQGQTNDKAGFTFARGLRAILRQDPDVVMVGEIRDTETLDTAVEASLTGHLVLSTVHTNSAVATVTRLLEMDLEPYLLASAVSGVVAQRLIRRICQGCRTPIPTPAGLRHLFADQPPETLYRGAGCKECRGTGFRGRLGIYELLVINEELRGLIYERAPEARLLDAARRKGMSTLREECLARVVEGESTLEEVVRVTQERQ